MWTACAVCNRDRLGHSPGRSPPPSRLPNERAKLRRYGLIIVDEVGYLSFEQDAANLFFQLVSSRYEHASLVLTSNLPFSGWASVFGDQVVAAAPSELEAALDDLDPSDLSQHGLILERNLDDVTAYSVGQVRLDGLTVTYCGTRLLGTTAGR